MNERRKWRFFGVLMIPFLILLLLSIIIILFTHSNTMSSMRDDVEKSRIQVAENIASSVGTLLEQVNMSATNLAMQLDKATGYRSSSLSLYNATIDRLVSMQLSNETMLNPLVSRAWVFLFDEERAFTSNSSVYRAQELYEKYVRINNDSYDAFRTYFTQNYFRGALLPNIRIGYMDEVYDAWIIAQTVPVDANEKTRGVVLFLLDMYDLQQLLRDGLEDADSFCLMMEDNGSILMTQGANERWTNESARTLLAGLPQGAQGLYYLRDEKCTEYLTVVIEKMNKRFVTVQPLQNAMGSLNGYNIGVMLAVFSALLLAASIAILAAQRNVRSAQTAMASIAPGNQPESASDVFEYMHKAILSSQEKEALLSAHADHQQALLQSIFYKRLLRGEFIQKSDLLREQHLAAVTLEGKHYAVMIIRFWQTDEITPVNTHEIHQTLIAEFGQEQIRLIDMSADTAACLLISEEQDLRESLEAITDILTKRMNISCFVGSTVTHRMDISRSYREARTMMRMSSESDNRLMWYCDLFQDDVLYNFEYSQYIETKLRNTIAAGNVQDVQQLLNELYQNIAKGSVHSIREQRFFAYDLYRLVNHIGGNTASVSELAVLRKHLQEQIDSVIEDPKNFDAFYDDVKQFCLRICVQNKKRQQNTGNDLLPRVQEYIDAEFANPLLTVAGIAEHFKLSDKYLSQLFREQTGETISSYLESKRLAHACHLLETTDLTVNEIATASGYALTHTFRVAFKKKNGVTPLQWKSTQS